MQRQSRAASPQLIEKLGHLADRISVNIELPSQKSLNLLAPQKSKDAILRPMGQISSSIAQNKQELALYRHATQFAPAGQSTQMIIGASQESDYQILSLTAGLYKKYGLKRVFFSAYVRLGRTRTCPWWISRRFCGSTGSIRRTGSCGFMGLTRRKF